MGMKKLNMLGIMASAMSTSIYKDSYNDLFSGDETKPKRIPRPIRQVLPKGAKEYFFNSDGEFSTKRILKSECIFKCIAINDKNALRKFNKQLNK